MANGNGPDTLDIIPNDLYPTPVATIPPASVNVLGPSRTVSGVPLGPTGATPVTPDMAPTVGPQTAVTAKEGQLPQFKPKYGNVIEYDAPDITKALGVSQEAYDTFRSYLAKRESQGYGELPNGIASAPVGLSGQTRPGYMGRYQMGSQEIIEAANGLNIPVPSQQGFLGNPLLQEKLFERYQLGHHEALMNNPQYANGDSNTRLALLAGAHLGGPGGVLAWQKGNNRKDVYGTSVGNYITSTYAALTGKGDIAPQYSESGPQYAHAGGRAFNDASGSSIGGPLFTPTPVADQTGTRGAMVAPTLGQDLQAQNARQRALMALSLVGAMNKGVQFHPIQYDPWANITAPAKQASGPVLHMPYQVGAVGRRQLGPIFDPTMERVGSVFGMGHVYQGETPSPIGS